jgi:uncharacterized LabA/DUF88 family protein
LRGQPHGWLSLFLENCLSLRTAIYVDAFNLYYGAVKQRPACKWLNIKALCQRMLRPENEIVRIVYCTARVKPRAGDPGQPVRQNFYLRALATIPCLIIEGRYKEAVKRLPVAPRETLFDDQGRQVRFASVLRTEEKGSDVNLATHMLIDGFQNLYDVAILISADTDLAEPVRLTRVALRKKVGILAPYPRLSEHISRHASFWKPIQEADLLASQFPETLTDAQGPFHRPPEWK